MRESERANLLLKALGINQRQPSTTHLALPLELGFHKPTVARLRISEAFSYPPDMSLLIPWLCSGASRVTSGINFPWSQLP